MIEQARRFNRTVLLAASAVQIDVCDPRHPDARRAVHAYVAELTQRFEDGFDPAIGVSATDDEVSPPAGLFLLATLHSEPVGCGVLKFHQDAPAHIKRMWVSPDVRGLGLGRRLLGELEARAAAHGVRTLRLETNRALNEAISLYRTAGYREVTAFNDEPYAHHWFEKTIGALPRPSARSSARTCCGCTASTRPRPRPGSAPRATEVKKPASSFALHTKVLPHITWYILTRPDKFHNIVSVQQAAL